MDTERHPEKSLFRVADVDVSQLGPYRDAIRDMYDRKLDGVIIRNVFPKEAVAMVTERLKREDVPFSKAVYEWGHVFGRVLYGSNANQKEYYETATQFRRQCRTLFEGTYDFEARVEEVLGAVSSGTPVGVMTGPEGESYSPATIRFMYAGHGLALHCGNQFMKKVSRVDHLAMTVQHINQLSYFVVLDEPEAGGELVLYELDLSEPTHEAVERNSKKMPLKIGAGDFLLFEGGQIWHAVSTVQGSRTRVTIGGFVAFGKNRDRVVYWS